MNYYDILGVNRNASDDEIKKAFKKAAVKYHPDRWSNKPENERKEAEDKFKNINEAYQVLSDPNKKSHYDRFGTIEGFNQGGGFSGFGGFDMDDIFDIFSGGRRRRQQQSKPTVEPGQTIQHQINVSIEEIFKGIHRDVEYKINVRCSDCNGEGGTDIKTCPHCHGTGTIIETQQNGFMTMQSQHMCGHCHGTGKIIGNPCKKCYGSGFETKTVTTRIDLNPGFENGSGIRIQGKGCESKNPKGQNGDLILVINYGFDQNKYKIISNTVYEQISIPYYDAILGITKAVKLPSGKTVTIDIPSYSMNGTLITLNREGINGGNYIFVVHVHMPLYADKSELELLEQIKSIHNK